MRPFPSAAPSSRTDRFLGFNDFKSHHIGNAEKR